MIGSQQDLSNLSIRDEDEVMIGISRLLGSFRMSDNSSIRPGVPTTKIGLYILEDWYRRSLCVRFWAFITRSRGQWLRCELTMRLHAQSRGKDWSNLNLQIILGSPSLRLPSLVSTNLFMKLAGAHNATSVLEWAFKHGVALTAKLLRTPNNSGEGSEWYDDSIWQWG